MKHYHYIFAGAGLSSLLTVYQMVVSGNFKDKSILLIDADTKKSNDRTWCFWEEGIGEWEDIVYKKWDTALFANDSFSTNLDFGSYKYKMVRGIDFYNFIFNRIKQCTNIEFVNQKVIDFVDLDNHVLVKTAMESFTCNKLFNNIYNPALAAGQDKYQVLQQHFVGWHIKTDAPVFNDGRATFMDFSVPQKGNTRFMYVLPVSPNEALVEYTLFSKDLLPLANYENAIIQYLKQYNITDYVVSDSEKGSIPMTAYEFWKNNTKNIINVGSAGGWTKASTGYTFKHADKKAKQLVAFLQTQDDLRLFHKKNKFWFYDLLLLDILYKTNEKGAAIFSALFKSGKAALIFKFLDEETSLAEDIQVILKCPKAPFIKALLRRIFNL